MNERSERPVRAADRSQANIVDVHVRQKAADAAKSLSRARPFVPRYRPHTKSFLAKTLVCVTAVLS
jgi:hypothetical protein